jgi:hypothetical protein
MTLAPERRESAKERSLRIPLDYLHRPDRLVRIKWQLSALLTLLAGGYVASLAWFPRWGRVQASPGALSAAHQSFHDDCRVCHLQPLAPLRSDAVDLAHWHDPRRAREAAEGGCLRCHEVSGHHASALADDVPRCAACHREHRGLTAELRRTADAQCTRCHAAIARHRQGESQLSPALADVTAFAGSGSHPTFRSLASGDPGNVHFNHWLHLQPGIAPSTSQRQLKKEDLSPDDRPRYAAREDGLLQLTCADCHQPDPRTGGAHMRPIAYAEHCQACHPLEVAIVPDGPPLAVPHKMDRATLAALVDGLLVAHLRTQPRFGADQPPAGATPREGPGRAASSLDDLPLAPGRTLGRNLAQRLAADFARQRDVALRAVAGRCLQCHVPRFAAAGSRPTDGSPSHDDPSELPELAPAAIPSRWLAHARFDHSAHRHVACRECHAAAYRFEQPAPIVRLSPPSGDARFLPARDADEVMIADRDTCLRCHTPRRQGQGGARHDCTGCHDYHGGSLRLGQIASTQADGRREFVPRHRSLVQARPVSQVKPPASYVDDRSCAAAGCHGSTRPDASPSARAAMIWLSRDPHREAQEVLWTVRARQMTARLLAIPASADRRAAPPDRQSSVSVYAETISDDQHVQVLRQRCVACHAVPGRDAVKEIPYNEWYYSELSSKQGDFLGELGGVGCQACHGPAAHWLHTHDRHDFDRKTPGFVDTKLLPERAAVCMPCHVGPAAPSGGRPQVVDHDLIAAGHPRLAFDFLAYFESLPGHWDGHRDQEKYRGVYSFALWRAGHDAQVAQESHLAQWLAESSRSASPEGVGAPEFSTIDCQQCHHSLAPPDQRTSPGGLWRPRVVSLSLGRSPDGAFPPWGDRLEAAARALESIALEGLTYDTACRMYSLVRAIAADLPPVARPADSGRETDQAGEPQVAARSALVSALAAAGKYLARESFPNEVWQGGEPTLYDGPTAFAPAAWSRHRDALAAALRQLRGSLEGKGAPGEVVRPR